MQLSKIQLFNLENGGKIAVEASVLPAEEERISTSKEKIVEETNKSFSIALKSVQQAAEEVTEGFIKKLNPDELQLTFGLKFTAEAGVILASASAESTMEIQIVWKKENN